MNFSGMDHMSPVKFLTQVGAIVFALAFCSALVTHGASAQQSVFSEHGCALNDAAMDLPPTGFRVLQASYTPHHLSPIRGQPTRVQIKSANAATPVGLQQLLFRIGNPALVVEGRNKALIRAVREILADMRVVTTHSRKNATLLLRVSCRILNSDSGYRMSVTVELVERGGNVFAVWKNDPSLRDTNRVDSQSISYLIDVLIALEGQEFAGKFAKSLYRLSREGLRHRINIDASSGIDVTRLTRMIRARQDVEFIEIDGVTGEGPNNKWIVLRVRYRGTTRQLMETLSEPFQMLMGKGQKLGKVEIHSRQVATMRSGRYVK